MPNSEQAPPTFGNFSFFRALRQRRSRRFGKGMRIPSGPLAYQSKHAADPLNEAEKAALAFAASGITGPTLADLAYGKDGGGNILAGRVGRTIASGDAIQSVALVVTDDTGTWLVRRPHDMETGEIHDVLALAEKGELEEIYRKTRVKVSEGRCAVPLTPITNLPINRWALFAPGSTYFLPINDLTLLYINGLLEIFNEYNGVFVMDERAGFRPAGVGRYARSKGGHLEDDASKLKVATIRQVEVMVSEFATIEQGMMLQNLALMTEALALGGYPNFANHEFAWFQSLGFRMHTMDASRYLGTRWLERLGMKLLGKDFEVEFPLGLEANGKTLLKPYCPPYHESMEDAVRAVAELKFGEKGAFRCNEKPSAWTDSRSVMNGITEVSERAIETTIAYCNYVFETYGRFPATKPPYTTVMGFQACRLDTDFYEKFYKKEALGQNHWDRGNPGKD